MPHSAVVVGRQSAAMDIRIRARSRRRRSRRRTAGGVPRRLPDRRRAGRPGAEGLRALQCRTALRRACSAARVGSRVRVKGRTARRTSTPSSSWARRAPPTTSRSPPLRARKTYVDARVPRTARQRPGRARLRRRRRVRALRRPAHDRHRSAAGHERRGRQPRDRRRGPGQPRLLRRRAHGPGLLLVRGYAARQRRGRARPPRPTASRSRAGSQGGRRPVAADGDLGRHRRRQVQRDGRYAFRVSAQSAVGRHRVLRPGRRAAARPPRPIPGSFLFQRNIFPIRGAHTFGTGAAAFGGGRGHQGQDVFAECGTPLVAAPRRRREVQAVPVARRQLPRHRRRPHELRLRLHAPARRRRSSTRATTSTPASRSASSATRAAPTAATCTSRSGRRRAGTAAAARSTRCRCWAWDKTS